MVPSAASRSSQSRPSASTWFSRMLHVHCANSSSNSPRLCYWQRLDRASSAHYIKKIASALLTIAVGIRRRSPSTVCHSLPASPAAPDSLNPSTRLPPRQTSETRTSTSHQTKLGKSSVTSMPIVSRSWRLPATRQALLMPRNAVSSS